MKQPTTAHDKAAATPPSIDAATLELRNLRLEGATEEPEEIRSAARELAEFKKAMK